MKKKRFTVYGIKHPHAARCTLFKEEIMLTKDMFASELNSFVLENGYNPCDILVSHGGAMLLHGLRRHTSDIDIHVSADIWVDQCIKMGTPPVSLGNGVWLLTVTDTIDIHVGAPEPSITPHVHACGFRYNCLLQTLFDYKRLNRSKDSFAIHTLESMFA